MTLYEFNLLSFEDKQKTVWDIGIYLDNYVTKDIKINCYAIDRFFVEVFYDSETNKITKVTSFNHGKELNKYSKF